MKVIFSYTLVFILLCSINTAKASHIFGGELLYTHLSGDNYKITLTLYGDCAGAAYQSLRGSAPIIYLYKDNTFTRQMTLSLEPNVTEVSPVCPEYLGLTSCKDSTSSIPGITRYIYSITTQMPPAAYWRILFKGEMSPNSNSYAGRSNSITNINFQSGGVVMFLEATLNNLTAPNSSPQFTTIPTPFYCINLKQQYNQGASDPNNDSLSFSLIPALKNETQSVTYIPPYTGLNPLSVQGTNFSFDNLTGQMSFVPDLIQYSLIVNRVEEYKNGVLVGSSMREMTFIVLDNCNNTPPNGDILASSISGGKIDGNNIINACTDQNKLNFRIDGLDPDNNKVSLAINNLPTGATAIVNSNNSTNPSIDFNWDLTVVLPGTYNIYVTYKDDACPLSASQTIAYTIRVIKPLNITHDELISTNCRHQAYLKINLDGGYFPRTVTVTDTITKKAKTYIDSSGTILDSFAVGTYHITLSNNENIKCGSAEYYFQVEDRGVYPDPVFAENLDLCVDDSIQPFNLTPVDGATLIWYDYEGKMLPGEPTYTTTTPAIYTWYITQEISVCESVRDTLTVTVHDYPNITIKNMPEQLCIGDRVDFIVTGGVRYFWTSDQPIQYNRDSSEVFTQVLTPSTYYVKGISEYGCINYDSITYDNIEQCCTFSYPTAFTPNSDGKNDGWRVLQYGNAEYFILSIYNRWGQRIFTSSNPYEYWDGRFGGKDCELGTYYYYVRAKCFTGHVEETKGTFLLLR